MAITMGEPVRLYIQKGDGTIEQISGVVTQLSTYQRGINLPHTIGEKPFDNIYWDGTVETDITVIGKHHMTWDNGELAENIDATKTAAEWRCDSCDAVNLRKHRECQKCGFPRSFLYGL